MIYTQEELSQITQRHFQMFGKSWSDLSAQGQTEEIDRVAALFAIADLVAPPPPVASSSPAPAAKKVVAPAIQAFVQRMANRSAPVAASGKPRAVSAPLPKALFPAQRAPGAPAVAVKKGT